MCQTFLPQLSNTGRIVSLSSVASNINIYNEEIQNRFRSAATIADLEQMAQDFEVSIPGKFVYCYKPCPCTPRPLVITMIIIMIMIQPPGINHRFISNTKLEARPRHAKLTRRFFNFFLPEFRPNLHRIRCRLRRSSTQLQCQQSPPPRRHTHPLPPASHRISRLARPDQLLLSRLDRYRHGWTSVSPRNTTTQNGGRRGSDPCSSSIRPSRRSDGRVFG